ncbi:MAG: hypothetical protein K8R58_09165 [Bacteroidales bacterium]|nr:hypothetical protein [Bacteroidales bacterium]
MSKNIFIKHDVPVIDSFIEKFARKYIEQRSQTNADIDALSESQLFASHGFDSSLLKDIISKNSVALDFKREKGEKPEVLGDIYRSDLGELLMTYYFEEKIKEGSRFIIPLKNITFRERDDMPGRGMDAIGYRVSKNKLEVLLGEAKVSAQKRNPPDVVHSTPDSIYKTQQNYKNNLDVVVRRLSDFSKRLNTKDAEIIGLAILNIDAEKEENYSITFGCTLIRDYTCVDDQKDFGKMESKQNEFEHNNIHFSILSFVEYNIEKTVQMFYKKVQELIK